MYPGTRRFPPRVLLVLPTFAPSATIYIIKPLTQLDRQGKIKFDSVLETEVTVPLLKSSDLVLFCRNRDPIHNWILEECLSYNIPTAYDLDDNFWEVPLDLPYAQLFRSPERIQQLEKYITNVDILRVYSQHLHAIVSKFNRNTILVPPCIDMNLIPKEPLPKKDDKIRITYVTGRGGEDAFISLFSEDLLRIMDSFPGIVEMHWWGDIPKPFRKHPASYMHDIIHDYDSYLYQLARAGYDIGLAPLTPTSFNLSKTNTKYRDYGACRIAGIYSTVEVYTSCVQHEQTGVLVDNQPSSWFEAMSRLVTDHELRNNITASAFKFINENYRQELVEVQWLELIDSLLKNDRRLYQVTAKLPLPHPSKSVNLSLGCREQPPNGFIGIDRNYNSGVKVIADLNHPLPLATDCANLVLADHSLEQLTNPNETMKEIYRLSKHGSQLCINASYSWPDPKDKLLSQKHYFNEETPRLWTDSTSPVYKKWGLLSKPVKNEIDTNQSLSKIDLRCVRMEYFYYPEYLNLREEQKYRLRRENPQVCDQVLYHFIVVKEPINEDEVDHLNKEMRYFEPTGIVIRRLKDLNESLKQEFEQFRFESRTWRTEIADKNNTLETIKAQLEVMKTEYEHAGTEIAAKNAALIDKNNALEITKAQLEVLETKYERAGAETSQLQSQLSMTSIEFGKQMVIARHTARELDAFRNRKSVMFMERVFERLDDSKDLPPSLERLLDDSLIFSSPLKGYRLRPSLNLQRVMYLNYRVEFKKAGLCGAWIAPVLDLIPSTGVIGIEIVSPRNEIIVQVENSAKEVELGKPIHLTFPPILDTGLGNYEFRIFARGLGIPLRIYEWRKYSLLSLGHTHTKPFLGYDFAPVDHD